MDLDEYHHLNLIHTKKTYMIGIGIIGIGISIIIITLIVTFKNAATISTIASVSGLISGLLIDCIGGIFVNMHAKAMEAATSFEKGISQSVLTYLGNVIVTQIKDQTIREAALSEMAKELAKSKT